MPLFHKGEQGLWLGVAAATLGAGHRLGIGRGLPFDELLGARIIGDRFTLVHRPERVNQGTCPYAPDLRLPLQQAVPLTLIS